MKSGKKPEKLLQRVIELGSKKGDLVLDFHLGSGTTCAVAHKLGRRYIGVEQLDYGDNNAVVRLKHVIEGDCSGISRQTGWQGGGSFVYCELAKSNQLYIDKILSAKSDKELVDLWSRIKKKGFLSYKVDIKAVDASIDDFSKLSQDDKKNFLIEVLDKNMLYVNLSEMGDEDYQISEADKKLNRYFYSPEKQQNLLES